VRFGGLPRAFWPVWGGALVNRAGGFVEPFLVLYFAHRGVGTTTIGLLAALTGVGSLVSQPVGGILADRIGRRETIALGMAGAAASFVLLGLAQPLWLLAVAAVLAGGFVDLYRPASSALVADIVHPADRPRAYALQFWVVNAGFALAAGLAGVLAEAGYGLLFAFDGLTCLASAAIVWRGTAGVPRPPRAAGDRGGLGPACGDRVLLAFVGLTAAGACVYFQAYSTLALAMRADGLGPSTYGATVALNGAAIVLVQPIVTPWLLRRRRVAVLASGQALIGLGFGLEGLVASYAGYALPVLVWTAGEIAFQALAGAVVADLAPRALRGRYQGVYGLSFGAAGAVAPVAGAAVLAGPGARALWSGCAAVGVALGAGQIALAPALERRRPSA
jgi:MFS family permease